MISRAMLIAALLLACPAASPSAEAAEKECERWLKLVDGEVRERKEALEKKTGAERAGIQEMLTKTGAKVVEARTACKAGKDKDATLMALDLWDAFVDSERQAGALLLNSRLNIVALRIDRLKAFPQRGWQLKMSGDAERRFLEEVDKFDRVLADVLKQALR